MTDPGKILEVDVGDNVVDLALLKGFLGVSVPLRGLRVDFEGEGEHTLRVASPKAWDQATVTELLRVIGGSCKGDHAIRVRAPEAFCNEVAVPYARQGPERWSCPRCNRDVMAGANDAGSIGGLCESCWATEMRLAGMKDPKIERGASSSPNPGNLPLASASQLPASAPVHSPAPPRSSVEAIGALQPERSRGDFQDGPPFARVLEVRSAADLPAPQPGLLAVSHGRFYWATSSSWFYCDGHVPVVL
jgi:hypothetical protein